MGSNERQNKKRTSAYRQQVWLEIQVDGAHDDEDLLVLVCQAAGLLERRLAEVLHPAVLAQERRGQS